MNQSPDQGDFEGELAESRRRAMLGDLAPALVHECSNFVNVVLLQLAVLEMEMPDSVAPQLVEIRRQGSKFQKLVEQFHSYRKAQAQTLSPIRLDDAWPTLGHDRKGVWLRPATDLPRVMATGNDLRHLLEFFLTHAAQWGGDDAVLKMEHLGDRVLLRLQCPSANEEVESLEWLACRSLARRVQGKAYSKARPDQGRDYIVELQQAREG